MDDDGRTHRQDSETTPSPVALPTMTEAQAASWHGVMDLYDVLPDHWTLIGGQLVHLHCAERDTHPQRPTVDVDTVVDVRAEPKMLEYFTQALQNLGFTAITTGEGLQHRWTRNLAQIDVLIPEGVGEVAARRAGAGGAPTLSAPGASQALARSEAIRISANGRVGTVRRPSLLSAMVMKAATRTGIANDPARARHCIDFTIMAGMVAASDFRATELTIKDRQRLRKMVALCRSDPNAQAVENAQQSLSRIDRGAGLSR